VTLAFNDVRWFSGVLLPMISPGRIGKGIQVFDSSWWLPFQAVNDLFQVNQQRGGPVREAVR
jgi:hypothetical protein